MRTGLFGGTFSPPHKGHRRAAELFIKRAALDRLIVMPDGVPPHKEADSGATATDRYEMSRIAFGDIAEISDYEITKEGKSFTVDTLRWLNAKYPDDEIFMLIGEDMFLSLDTWRAPEEICSLATVVYMRRHGENAEALEKSAEKYKKQWGASLMYMCDEPREISSTEIREKLASGRAEDLISDDVYAYIKKHGLYGYGK